MEVEQLKIIVGLTGPLVAAFVGAWIAGRIRQSERWLDTKRVVYARFLAEVSDLQLVLVKAHQDAEDKSSALDKLSAFDEVAKPLNKLVQSLEEIGILSSRVEVPAQNIYEMYRLYYFDEIDRAGSTKLSKGAISRPQTPDALNDRLADLAVDFRKEARGELRTEANSIGMRFQQAKRFAGQARRAAVNRLPGR